MFCWDCVIVSLEFCLFFVCLLVCTFVCRITQKPRNTFPFKIGHGSGQRGGSFPSLKRLCFHPLHFGLLICKQDYTKTTGHITTKLVVGVREESIQFLFGSGFGGGSRHFYYAFFNTGVCFIMHGTIRSSFDIFQMSG